KSPTTFTAVGVVNGSGGFIGRPPDVSISLILMLSIFLYDRRLNKPFLVGVRKILALYAWQRTPILVDSHESSDRDSVPCHPLGATGSGQIDNFDWDEVSTRLLGSVCLEEVRLGENLLLDTLLPNGHSA